MLSRSFALHSPLCPPSPSWAETPQILLPCRWARAQAARPVPRAEAEPRGRMAGAGSSSLGCLLRWCGTGESKHMPEQIYRLSPAHAALGG